MNKFKNLKKLVWIPVIAILITGAAYAGYRLAYRGLIFPKVTVAGIKVGGMDKITALKVVNSYFTNYPNKVILRVNDKENEKINELKVERDFNWAAEQAFNVGRNGNLLTQIGEQVRTIFSPRSITVATSYDEEDLEGYVEQLATEINRIAVQPKLVSKDGKYDIVSGVDGMSVNTEQLTKMIVQAWGLPDKQMIDIPLERVSAKENIELANQATAALEKWGDRKLKIIFKDFQRILTTEEMAALFGLTTTVIDEQQFKTLLAEIQQQVETEPKDAVFVFENDKAKEFKPEVVGTAIDIPSFNTQLGAALVTADKDVLEIPVVLTNPKVKTSDINNLGIKELIGEGKSAFSHSIPGRVFNVNLASSRVNGTLVAPGEEFSFNKAVGDISKASGYQQAYIISGGKTVLGDGGGVCQVSTTVFRAALNAGLQITQRKAHAYRVGYYEQDSKPGIDATVYNPSADLRFLNDTGNYILVQITVDTKNLTMRVGLYGTKDGRTAMVTEPKISSQTPPPSTLYVDDPTLAVGQTKQIDWSAWGAKVSFNYKVTKGEQTVFEKTFYSDYQPWQAIYLRGTKS